MTPNQQLAASTLRCRLRRGASWNWEEGNSGAALSDLGEFVVEYTVAPDYLFMVWSQSAHTVEPNRSKPCCRFRLVQTVQPITNLQLCCRSSS